MFIPLRLRGVKKCPRCSLLFPYKEIVCTHCSQLNDREVKTLKQKYADEHEGNATLGKIFFVIAVLLLIVILIINSD